MAQVNREVQYRARAVTGLARLRLTVMQRVVTATAEALITVTDSLEAAMTPAAVNTRGLPGYTFERAAGELWRCRFDVERNIIVVNSHHRDFVFATRNRAATVRQRAGAQNFAGLAPEQLLERMIELSLYAEEKLKSGYPVKDQKPKSITWQCRAPGEANTLFWSGFFLIQLDEPRPTSEVQALPSDCGRPPFLALLAMRPRNNVAVPLCNAGIDNRATEEKELRY